MGFGSSGTISQDGYSYCDIGGLTGVYMSHAE